ncbi:uncharacterized protein BDZ83DRAFT_86305 [Colletotrichum acutatum]|uniref:Uncharacterized protein n=1 Tax=Glomerella acutata TaxID=27357 RepID=A0AAD8XK87_GLOAC|nr:uncharacterized protein BDZ83DRAFT_86305 [Colletotrichum acutatum]KAK1728900.1 hypothetical protein BDZ83DRAFT_86305 [Colletotrichum acutatum]
MIIFHVYVHHTERARGDLRTHIETQIFTDTLLLNHFAHDLISYHNPTKHAHTHP